jgi:hypothetical protein
MRRTALALLAGIALAGCASTSSTSGPATASPTAAATPTEQQPTPAATSRCETPSPQLVAAISDGLTITGGGSLRGAQAVRSADFEKVWFVSADLEGSGLEGDDEIATWSTNDLDGRGMIFSVNAVAREFSEWGSGPGFSMSDEGATESAECVKNALAA